MAGAVSERIVPQPGSDPTQIGETDSAPAEQRRLGLIALCAFALLTCVAGLGDGPMMGDHECIVAQSARQTIQTGEWLIPRVGEIPRIRKTPLGIWLVAASSTIFSDVTSLPVSNHSARLPSAFAGLMTSLVVFWLGRMMYGYRTALVGGFIAAGCLGTILYARNAQVDMTLTLFTALAYACFWRGVLHERPARWAMMLFYACFGIAMMAKGPLPLATVGVSLAVFWFVTLPLLKVRESAPSQTLGATRISLRPFLQETWVQFRRLPVLWLIPGVILFAVISGAWPLYAYRHVDNAAKLWKMEYMERFTGDMSEKRQSLFYYVPVLFGLTFPFMLSLPEAFAAPFLRRYLTQRKGLAFAFTWAVAGTLCLSAAAFKRPHYVLSMLPAYCLLLAPVIDRLFFGCLQASESALRRACTILPAVLAVAAVVGGVVLRKEFPSLLIIYGIAATLLFVIWTSACIAFSRQRRLSAFALLNLGTLVILLLGWPAAGSHLKIDAEAHALAAEMGEHGIRPGDEIYLVGGRPNSAIEFYSGLRIRRLINELEMADLRQNRRDVSDSIKLEIQHRMEALLNRQDRPAYLIIESGYYELFRRYSRLRAKPVLELKGFARDEGDELMIITQTWNPICK